MLILINDAPYGTEKAYNGLRLANQLNKVDEDVEVRIFLMADAASCAVAGQNTTFNDTVFRYWLRNSLGWTEGRQCAYYTT